MLSVRDIGYISGTIAVVFVEVVVEEPPSCAAGLGGVAHEKGVGGID